MLGAARLRRPAVEPEDMFCFVAISDMHLMSGTQMQKQPNGHNTLLGSEFEVIAIEAAEGKMMTMSSALNTFHRLQ